MALLRQVVDGSFRVSPVLPGRWGGDVPSCGVWEPELPWMFPPSPNRRVTSGQGNFDNDLHSCRLGEFERGHLGAPSASPISSSSYRMSGLFSLNLIYESI